MCPEETVLSAYYDEEIEGAWREKIRHHVGECKMCLSVLSGYREQSALMKAAGMPNFTPDFEDLQRRIRRRRGLEIPRYRAKRRLVWIAAMPLLFLFAVGTLRFVGSSKRDPYGKLGEQVAAAMRHQDESVLVFEGNLDEVVSVVNALNGGKNREGLHIDLPEGFTFSYQEDVAPRKPF